MSKAVMMSIQPQWCELIANGQKTIEVRKTKPKLETPFKAYIYCTKGKEILATSRYFDNTAFLWYKSDVDSYNSDMVGNGKVIGEFVCDKVFDIYKFSGSRFWLNETLVKATCLTEKEINDYGKGKDIFGWHISNLVIYDKPKELSEFYRLGKPLICDGRNCENCNHLKYMQVNSDEWDYDCDCQHQLENRITLKRPPQSWCYVEESK